MTFISPNPNHYSKNSFKKPLRLEKSQTFNQNGYIVWEGLSPLDQKPIVMIATGFKTKSQNSKTGGDMIQTFIVRQDVPPNVAFENGEGFSVCGDCCHAKYNNPKENGFDPCYVFVGRSVLAVWRAYRANRYQHLNGDYSKFANRGLRLGSFGDPSVVNKEVILKMVASAKYHTGYTHQWRQPFAQHLKGLVMASADGMRDYIESTANGWKPFHVRKSTDAIPQGAVMCPSSKEANRVSSCDACKLCAGDKIGVSIIAH